jgi:hypothetical protein
MTFSKEPIIWIGAIIAVAIVTKDILDGGGISTDSIDAAVVAVGAVIGRKLVTPVASVLEKNTQDLRR